MVREPQINEDPTLSLRTVLLSVVGLWLAYFLLTSLRGIILSYELQQAFGLDLQNEMLWRRVIVCLGGTAVTLVLWLLLRLFDMKPMWIKVVAALILALPAAALFAQVNETMFAPVQAQINAKLEAEGYGQWGRQDTGSVLDDVAPRGDPQEENPEPGSAGTRQAEAENPIAAQMESFRWLGLLDMAVSRYFLFLAWAALYLAMFTGSLARAAERRGERFRTAAKAAELRSLRYQVNPHFLFNSLNSLSALVMTGKPDRAEAMIQAMSNFYRHSLANEPTAFVALEDEFALQQHYLEIESVRFPERLIPVFRLPPELSSARIPGMILQPLVENSVKYGVAGTVRPVTVTVSASEDFGRLAITVCDDGPGAKGLGEPGFGIGLTNVRDRLEALYGKDANIASGPTDVGYCTEIRLPLRTHG